ncbi:MAG: DUF1249 domain-containing protein [Endozoicomonadaceae bacterium]|nr:DUF1249 domain-containing protein [Endozoicomonadaceae bacterium]
MQRESRFFTNNQKHEPYAFSLDQLHVICAKNYATLHHLGFPLIPLFQKQLPTQDILCIQLMQQARFTSILKWDLYTCPLCSHNIKMTTMIHIYHDVKMAHIVNIQPAYPAVSHYAIRESAIEKLQMNYFLWDCLQYVVSSDAMKKSLK